MAFKQRIKHLQRLLICFYIIYALQLEYFVAEKSTMKVFYL